MLKGGEIQKVIGPKCRGFTFKVDKSDFFTAI